MRTLAIDPGSKRVGLAMSDEGGQFATPYEVLTVAGDEHAIAQILDVIRKEGVQRIVMGLPLNMNDSAGPQARTAVEFGQTLAQKSGLPVLFVDERLSSFEAEQSLNNRKRHGEKLTRQRRKQQLDAVAAASFLQQFLDGKLMAIDPDVLEY